MNSYRAELTIWHFIFSVDRQNHMSIAVSLSSHWLHQFLLRLDLQFRMPKPLIILLRHCFRSRGLSSFSSSCTHYDTYSFDNSLFRHLRTSHWSLITRQRMNSPRETLGTLSEEFSRICMLVCLLSENSIYDKRYMLRARATVKIMCRECTVRVLVAEAPIEKEGVVSRFQLWKTQDLLSTWHRFIDSIGPLGR